MTIWCIFGGGLPEIYVHAESFDEALKKARGQNNNYCAGYVFDEDSHS